MGALAITTVVGTELALRAPQWVVLASLLPFIKGFTLFFWAAGTWWIPLLIVLGIWRQSVGRQSLAYDLQYWGIIFPLGMYTVCTYNISKVLNLQFLENIPRVSVFVALGAWALLFGALVHVIANDLKTRFQTRSMSEPSGRPS
jgi:tellurite resistance protein TehA-like permease